MKLKLSAFIQELQEIQAEFGDLNIVGADDDSPVRLTVLDKYDCETNDKDAAAVLYLEAF